MNFEVLKNLTHQGKLHMPGAIVHLEDELSHRLISLGVIKPNVEKGSTDEKPPVQPTPPNQAAPKEQLAPEPGIEEEKTQTTQPEIEEGGSETQTQNQSQPVEGEKPVEPSAQ